MQHDLTFKTRIIDPPSDTRNLRRKKEIMEVQETLNTFNLAGDDAIVFFPPFLAELTKTRLGDSLSTMISQRMEGVFGFVGKRKNGSNRPKCFVSHVS